MDKDNKKKIIGLLVLMAAIVVQMIVGPKKQDSSSTQAVTETDAAQETEAPQEQDPGTLPAEESDTQSWISGLITEDEDDTYLDFVEAPVDGVTDETHVGNLAVSYATDDAAVAVGKAGGQDMTVVWYHDGNEEDMKGFLFSVETFADTDERPADMTDLVYLTDEFEQDGTGVDLAWEEDEKYFVRRISGYDSENGAYISYTIIPKEKASDTNMYTGIVTLSGEVYEPHGIKESSYYSMMDALLEMVPDSQYLSQDYEDAVRELTYINYHKSADGDSMGGVDDLREAQNSWYLNTYGVALDGSTEKTLSDLTEEEKKEAEWKSADPAGYSAYKKREEEREAAIEAEAMAKIEQKLAEEQALHNDSEAVPGTSGETPEN